MSCTNLSHLKKYALRDSPPFPANQCKGHLKRGNDGTYFKSVRAINGVYRWQRVSSLTAKKTAKRSPKKKTAKKTAKRSPKKKTAKKTAKRSPKKKSAMKKTAKKSPKKKSAKKTAKKKSEYNKLLAAILKDYKQGQARLKRLGLL